MAQRDVQGHGPVGVRQSARESQAGAGGGQRLETKMAQIAGCADVPGIRDDETPALVQLPERGAHDLGLYQVAQFSRGAGELAGLRAHHFVGEGQEQVAHRARHYRVLAGLQATGVSRQERGHAAGLVGIGFGVLVHINE